MFNGVSQKGADGGRGISLFILSAILVFAVSCKKDPVVERIQEMPVMPLTPSKQADPNQSHPAEISELKHPRSDEYVSQRQSMVETIRRGYKLDDERVLAAMGNVPRHWFVPDDQQSRAYIDSPLPIGYDQTISQPFIVAFMTSLLQLDSDKKVLEIGTGSGYQAAVLSELTEHIYTIEIVEPLGRRAATTFRDKGYTTICAKIGDGYKGWSEYAPFDAIIVTCAPDHIPPDLIKQLKMGGKMIIPVGSRFGVQELILVTKDEDSKIHKESKLPVRFVPLTRDKGS